MDEIFGRGDEISRLTRHQGGLLLVTGDSGVGKSTVLGRAQRELASCGAPSVGAALAHDGALQSVLLGQLAEACEQALPVEGRERLIEALRRIGERVAKATGKEVGRALAKQLISLIRARYGDEVVDASGRLLTDLMEPDGGDVLGRISQLADADSVRALGELAAQVVSVTGPVTLFIDRGERLTESDFGLLTECQSLLPREISLVVAYRVASAADADRVRTAVARGAGEITIEPLPDDVVEAWATSAGISHFQTTKIVRLAGGYPLLVESAIRHISGGGTLDDLHISDAFPSLTESAWKGLSFEARRRGRVLASFPDPPPTELICALLEVDESVWRTIEEELREARIFSSRSTGPAWFHERRRRVIWDSILTEEERRDLADRVLRTLSDFNEVEGFISFFVVTATASLAPYAREFRNLAGVDSVLGLNDVELALLYSLIELLDGDSAGEDRAGPRFVDTDSVLTEARAQFATAEDLVSALESLAAQGLVYVASNERASIVTLTAPSVAVYELLLGRHVLRFGRAPQPRLASAMFDVVFRAVAKNFSYAVYGIGRPTLSHMQRSLNEIPREVHRYPRPPSILLRAQWGTRQFYLATEYEDAQARDACLSGYQNLPEHLWGNPLTIGVIRANPGQPYPDGRFVAAASTVAGVAQWTSSHAPDGPEDIDPVRAAELRLAITEHIRTRASSGELMAVGLDEARGYAVWRHDARGHTRIEYVGGGPDVRVLDAWDIDTHSDPLFAIKALQRLGLPTGANIARVHSTMGFRRQDPVADVVLEYREKMRAFNRDQQDLYVDVRDVESTSALLVRARVDAYLEAKSLYEAGIPVLGRRQEPSPSTIYAVLVEGDRRGADLKHYSFVYAMKRSEAPGFQYVVADPGAAEAKASPAEILRGSYGFALDGDFSTGWTDAAYGVANWLSLDPSSVRVSNFPWED